MHVLHFPIPSHEQIHYYAAVHEQGAHHQTNTQAQANNQADQQEQEQEQQSQAAGAHSMPKGTITPPAKAAPLPTEKTAPPSSSPVQQQAAVESIAAAVNKQGSLVSVTGPDGSTKTEQIVSEKGKTAQTMILHYHNSTNNFDVFQKYIVRVNC